MSLIAVFHRRGLDYILGFQEIPEKNDDFMGKHVFIRTYGKLIKIEECPDFDEFIQKKMKK